MPCPFCKEQYDSDTNASHEEVCKDDMEYEKKKKSPCCNAELDYGGGGYDGERLCNIETYCKKCKQLLKINGSSFGVEIINPKTGKEIND